MAGAILAACVCLGPAGGAFAQATDPLPPTITRIVVEAKGASRFEGQGTPGSLVRLILRGKSLGETRVEPDNRWRIIMRDGLPPGVHQIQSAAIPVRGGADVLGDEIRVSIPEQLVDTVSVTSARDAGRDTPAVAPATRDRAEGLAQAASGAFTEVLRETETAQSAGQSSTSGSAKITIGQAAPPAVSPSPKPKTAPGNAQNGEADGALGVVVDWLRRSARAYSGEIVDKLAGPAPGAGQPAEQGISATEAARRLLLERRAAEAELEHKRQSEAKRKAANDEARAREAARKEAAARKAAEDLERRQAEYKERIAKNLRDLEAARKAADAQAARKPGIAAQAPETGRDGKIRRETLTFEPITLPGDHTAAAPEPSTTSKEPAAARTADATAPAPSRRTLAAKSTRVAKWSRQAAPSRCPAGRVMMRNGRRWYVAGKHDTLWDIAERFYGAGIHYPRIYRVNRSRMPSPHVVRPCQRLRLPEGRA